MIVVDTNIIGYLFLSGEQSALAERALLLDNEWAAPILWRSEFRNVLSLYMRKKILTLEQACQIMDNAMSLLKGREYSVPSNDVLKMTLTGTCSAYDCEFVAVAIDLKIPLVTADKQLLREFPSVAMSLKTFCKLEE